MFEPFLMEVIKLQQYEPNVDPESKVQEFFAEFQRQYGDTNGFGTAKGYKVEMTKSSTDENTGPIVILDWEGQQYLITSTMLANMIVKKNAFNEEVSKLAREAGN